MKFISDLETKHETLGESSPFSSSTWISACWTIFFVFLFTMPLPTDAIRCRSCDLGEKCEFIRRYTPHDCGEGIDHCKKLTIRADPGLKFGGATKDRHGADQSQNRRRGSPEGYSSVRG
ncbi:unnamed protein product [Cyprideis torosa]|uniref:Uncharacterized protein n=1 Tax=Cyprideis torosa TaxID=163714 RepID=A0A7R8W347_9CRUS|nr:unnamed protein product [Cyprideis torosa]CAG0880447.1 unnamed protein product [Cyprideis torosa]